MGLLIKNIKCLVQALKNAPEKICGRDMSRLSVMNDAFLLIRDGKIADFGIMRELPPEYDSSGMQEQIIDAADRLVFPSFCDPHTHIVYAGSRETEFTDKIRGLSYEEIAGRGGGILNSAKLLQKTSEDELFEQSKVRINEIIRQGTGAVEIKSGYGLTTADELKMLRVIKRIKETFPIEVRATFLGAHAVPEDYRKKTAANAAPHAGSNVDNNVGSNVGSNVANYVDLVINEMIPLVASEQLADYIDVFCDRGFFSVEETERILMAGLKYGLIPKIHANELDYSGGVQTGIKYDALSVDHLEYTGDGEIEALRNSDTIPTLLPGSSFFLGLPDPPARKMIDAGLPVALASDYNPGSSPSGNMKMIMSLGCIRLKMLPEEVINAVTVNSAYAMGLSDTHGSITRGKVANMFITKKIPSYEFMPYAFGSDLIETIILRGKIVEQIARGPNGEQEKTKRS